MSVQEVFQTKRSKRVSSHLVAKRLEMINQMSSLLNQYGHRGLGDVSLFLDDDTLIIKGRVRSYYLKQLAQEVLRPLAVDMRIRNELRVD